MISATMVCNDVHYDLQALLMSLVHKLPVKLVATHARVNFVIVPAGIAVIGFKALVVHQQRSAPNSGSAQLSHIVQMVDYALYVASVAAQVHVAVCLFLHSGHVVIGRIAIGKAVRENKIDHIGRSKALAAALCLFADGVRVFEPVAGLIFKDKPALPCLCS